MEDNDRRITNIELAITELTTLNRSQEEAASRQANSIEKILGHLQDMAVLRTMVNNNKVDIDKIGIKVDKMHHDMETKEDRMQMSVNQNKEEAESKGSSRLIKGMVISAAVSTFLFGYLYIDLHRAEAQVQIALSSHAQVEESCRERILQLETTVDVYKHKHNGTNINYPYKPEKR